MAITGKYARLSIETGSGRAYTSLASALTTGVVVIEFDLKIKADTNSYNGVVINASDPAVNNLDRIVGVFSRPTATYTGNIEFVVYNDAAGATTWYDSGIPADGAEHHIKIQIDLVNKTIDAWVDATQVLTAVGYTGSQTGANQVQGIIILIGDTANTAKQHLYIDNLVITQDAATVYSEDFEAYNINTTPTGWAADDPQATGSNPVFLVQSMPPFTLGAGTELAVSITGYDGSIVTQHVHPTLLDFVNKLSNGYEYMMIVTPYPNGINAYEHPSIVYSNDMTNWTENGAQNPIVPVLSNIQQQADPHVVWDPVNKRFLLYFQTYYTDGTITISVAESKDGINWTVINRNAIIAPAGYTLVSPSVIYDDAAGVFRMLVVQKNLSAPYDAQLLYYESTDGVNWTQGANPTFNKPVYEFTVYDVWHLTVRRVGTEYWLIGALNPEGSNDGAAPIHLFLAKSTDFMNWTFYEWPILTTAASLATDRLYRADFFIKNGDMTLVYSYLNADGTWHLALVTQAAVADPTLSSDNVVEDQIQQTVTTATKTGGAGWGVLLLLLAIGVLAGRRK